MKKARKLITFILTVVMVLSMSMNVWADGDGVITITNAEAENSYSIYRILDLESYVEDSAYVYRVNSDWTAFIAGAGNEYLTVTDGYVTWKGENTEARVAEFAELALNYAKENDIAPVSSKVADSNTVTFDNLDLGYYLVDSSMGILCSLDTTDKEVDIEEKNVAPEVTKLVETSDGSDSWEESNTVFIGDTVNFKVTITAQPGAENYILHDTLDSGLDFDANSVAIEDLTKNTDYTVTTSTDGCCTFEIEFSEAYLDTIEDATDIVVTYSAILNENAEVGTTGNANTTYLEYGSKPYVDSDEDGIPDDDDDDDDDDGTLDDEDEDDDNDGILDGEDEIPEKPTTPSSETQTYTYSFDLVKTDSARKVLTGATFELYQSVNGDDKINLVQDGEGYRVATPEEIGAGNFQSAVISAGHVEIRGLKGDNTTYYLQETAAPQGYNPISGRTPVTIANSNNDATVTANVYESGGVQVENNTGSELPSTGGIGTTIFYIVGGALVLFAVVLLVTKKRMKDNQ